MRLLDSQGQTFTEIMIAITIIDYTGFGSMYTTGLPGAQGLIGAP